MSASPAAIDFTEILPLEVIVSSILPLVSVTDLASLRLVSRAACQAASDPQLYRTVVLQAPVLTDEPNPRGGAAADALQSLHVQWYQDRLDLMPPQVSAAVRRVRFASVWSGAFVSPALIEQLVAACPNLTSLNLASVALGFHQGHLEACPAATLRELNISRCVGGGVDDDHLDALGGFGQLECLSVGSCSRAARLLPIEGLSSLRRLSLWGSYDLDVGALVFRLADSPCAPVLEALNVYRCHVIRPATDAPQWWTGLAFLPALCELGCTIPGDTADGPEEVADAIVRGGAGGIKTLMVKFKRAKPSFVAALLPALTSVTRLHLGDGKLPPNVASILPEGLESVHFPFGLSGDSVGALLDRCPGLRMLALSKVTAEMLERVVAADHACLSVVAIPHKPAPSDLLSPRTGGDGWELARQLLRPLRIAVVDIMSAKVTVEWHNHH